MSAIKREYQLKRFGLNYAYPDRFLWCQWQLKPRTSRCYLMYRWLFACYFIFTTIYVLHAEPLVVKCADECPKDHTYYQGWDYLAVWPAYLTNWGYILIVVNGMLAAIIVTCGYVKESFQKDENDAKPSKMPVAFKLYWAMHTIAMVTAIGITVTYWITVYCPTEPIHVDGAMKHITNSACMLIDFFVVSHPFQILHFYLPVLFVAIYLAFSAAYYAAGGLSFQRHTYLYSILKWENPGDALINCIAGLIFVVFLHHLVFVLYLFRRWLHSILIVPKGVDPSLYSNSVTVVNTA